jgi:hypothetical protein
MRIGSYFYTFLSLIRLFKGFSVQPRLALVTETLKDASIDLAHFGIVFFSVFYAYALLGMIIFGRDMEDYTTLMNAFVSCWRLVMGDFDWM